MRPIVPFPPKTLTTTPHFLWGVRAGFALISSTLLSGCPYNCKGPSCDEDWPRTRIGLIDIDSIGIGGKLENVATTFLEGTNDERAKWALGASDSGVWIGQPEANQVVELSLNLERASSDGTPWTGSGSFGASVTLPRLDNGQRELWISAPDQDLGAGAIYRFLPSEGGLDATEARLRVVGGSAANQFGSVMVRCGDLTGDGADELLVTAPWFEAPEGSTLALDSGEESPLSPLSGAVFLLKSEAIFTADGTVYPWELGPTWWGEATGDQAGAALSCDADHDGDGFLDIVIGAPLVDVSNELTDAGRVYLISGAELPEDGSLADIASVRIDGDTAHGWLGMSLQSLDLNPEDGERALDLAVGSPGSSGGRGHVQIHLGADLARGGIPKPSYQFTLATKKPGHFGRWIATGDLDGDARSDLVIGAPDLLVDNNGYDQGRAWLFFGASIELWEANGTSALADIRILGDHPFERLGRSPWFLDTDGDGRDELLLPSRARILD